MQVRLTEGQLQSLRQMSAVTGQSIADLIRQGVELYLSTQHRFNRAQQFERALRVAGKYSSGTKDGSANHDHYSAEAFRN